MKIVIVLCSLATFAIAVPVYQENVFESSLSDHPLSTKRERKSVLPDITPGSSDYGIEKILTHSNKKSSQGTAIEAKSFRKPIIITRKLGYHVYRDSDEEMAYAEPGEKCREHVKFKLCDHEPLSSSKNRNKSPTFKCLESSTTDNEVENSIKMAKKAVDYLQKDLKRMENFSPKVANAHIEDIESNNGLHHDIEIAREALEHIEQNFESVNSEVNKVNDFDIPKSQDVERLTRWREAIENIHKNFEIVKNIEDTFKTDNYFPLFRSDNRKTVESEDSTNTEGNFNVQNKFTNDNLKNNDETYNEYKELKSASNEDGIVQLTTKTENIENISKDVGHDMFISPSENREKKLHSDSLKSEINYKDASVKSGESEIESHTNYEHEKAMNDHSSNDYALLPKLSSSSYDSYEKSMDNSELMMKAVLPEQGNRNQLIKMKPVNEIIENKRKQVKTASNDEYINEYEKIYFNTKNENVSPERLSVVPKSTIVEAFKEEASMRSAENQNEKLQLKENQETPIQASTRLDIETNSDDTSSQLFKSVPELPYDPMLSMPTEEVVITDDNHVHKEQASMKSSESQYENVQLNKYEEVPNQASTRLDIKTNSDDTTSQFLKSVPELELYPVESMPLDTGDTTNDEQFQREEVNMRLSESQNQKVQSIEYQEAPKQASTRLDIETNLDDTTSQFLKSVPELELHPVESVPLDPGDTTNNEQSQREEVSMRSSESQNEELQIKENQETPNQASTRLDIETNSDDTTSQFLKSVPELLYDPMLSMPTEEVVVTDDNDVHKEQASMKSSESQYENVQLNKYEDAPNQASTRLDIETNSDDTTSQFLKSVPELELYPVESVSLDKGDITNDEQSQREEVSMRSSESQNEELQIKENQETPNQASKRLDIETNSDDTTSQFLKSVPELLYEPMLSMPTEEVVITDDNNVHKEQASVRSSESQNEELLIKENQETPNQASTRLDIETNSDDTTSQFLKSVPELLYDPMLSIPTEEVVVTDDNHVHKEQASMRSSESQNEKVQLNKYQEAPSQASTRLDIETNSDDTTFQLLKSVPELPYDSILSMPTDEVFRTDDNHAYKEEASMRSSESQNQKVQSFEYQEAPSQASTRLDIETNSDDTTSQFLKSVPELELYPVESVSLDKGDITNDEQSQREEVSMRSSESQNEKSQIKENQETPNQVSTRLDIETNSDDTTFQLLKSVPELPYDSILSMPTKEVVRTDDNHAYKEEASMRSSESQNQKVQSIEYQEAPSQASTILDIETNSDDTTSQFLKSVPELELYPVESMSLDKGDITNDEKSQREEVSMRSSESQNEELQIKENQETPNQASTRLDIETNSDDTTSQLLKSVPELLYDPMLSMPTEEVVITDDNNVHKEQASVRSSESQNEELQIKENQETPNQASTRLDIETNSDDTTSQFLKSVPELLYDPMLSMPTEEVVVTDDNNVHKEQASVRSSESQNEELQIKENQETPNQASTRLDIETNSDDTTSQFLKSVPELLYDPMLSMPTEEVVVTDDNHVHKEQASMRSSESQNEKVQSIEYQEAPSQASTRLDIETNSDDTTSQFLKSVPELEPYLVKSVPLNKGDIANDQESHGEEASMRSSEFKESQLNEYQEAPNQASMRLDIEADSDDKISKFLKTVPEFKTDPVDTEPLDKGDNTNNQHLYREEASMRLSESQNEKMQSSENQEVDELLPMGLVDERHPEERTWQYSKSVPELPYDPMLSMLTEGRKESVIIDNNHAHKEEASMRSSENQKEEMQSNEHQEAPKYTSSRLDIENNSDDTTSQSLKSVSEFEPSLVETESWDTLDITNDEQPQREEVSMRSSESQNDKTESSGNYEVHELLPMGLDIDRRRGEPRDVAIDQHSHGEEASMRSSENLNKESQLNEYQEEAKYASSRFDMETNYDDNTSKFLKSVSEFKPELVEIEPLDKGDITNDQHSHREEASMRSSESQNEKMQSSENQEVHEFLPMGLGVERHPEERTWQYSKSVPELPYDPMLSMPAEKVVSTEDNLAHKEEASMRLSENQNEKLQLNENQKMHDPLMIRLDMTNHPEQRTWLFSKSVPELPYDSMVSMPSDKVEITNEQHFLKEENMRLSQNQNDRSQFDENHGLHEFLPTKLEDARLSQDQNQRPIYFNHHLYEPHSSGLDVIQNFGDDSEAANKVRFNNIQDPIQERTFMRLSQNQNENKEREYPSRSLGLNNDMNREDNAAQNMNDFMHLSVAPTQQLHENLNPLLRSNERQHLSHNFKSLPEYKMLPHTSQFEFSNGQNGINEHINMRINQEQSRETQPMDNQYIHDSLLMQWNTENQQDPSPKTFKSNLDFDHTRHKSNEFGKEQFIPHEALKTVNTLEYRTRPQFFGNHVLDDTHSSRWFQHNDNFANYYKSIPEVQEEYRNPHFRNNFHRYTVNHRVNDADTFTGRDVPSSRTRLHDHMQKYHHEKPSNIDSSMETSMPMSMREPFEKSGSEFNNMHFNHPHGTARFGAGLPVAGVSPGAMGVFPTGSAGGCGIPLLLSCSPSVVSGSLARSQIAGPIFKSGDENYKYYMKRDAKNIADVPDIKIQKVSLPHSRDPEVTSGV